MKMYILSNNDLSLKIAEDIDLPKLRIAIKKSLDASRQDQNELVTPKKYSEYIAIYKNWKGANS